MRRELKDIDIESNRELRLMVVNAAREFESKVGKIRGLRVLSEGVMFSIKPYKVTEFRKDFLVMMLYKEADKLEIWFVSYTELPRKPRPLAAGMNWQNNCKNHLANSKYDSILQVRY